MSASCSAVGMRVDGAVAVDQHAVGQAHEEHARDDRDARARLDQLERRADRLRRRVGRAGDHPVGHPERDHQRAEVRRRRRRRRAPGRRSRPCARAAARTRARSARELRVAGSSTLRGGESTPIRARGAAHLRLRAQQGELDDAAAAAASPPRAARARPSPSGSTMCRALRPRAVEQRVLEHQRRHRARARPRRAGEQLPRRPRGPRTARARCRSCAARGG